MKTLIRYRYLDNLKAIGIMMLVMILIPLLSAVFVAGTSTNGGFFGMFCMAGAIFSLVIGIVTIFSDLRLGLQMGVGRKSVAAAQIFSAFLTSATLAVFSTLLLLMSQILMKVNSEVEIADIYQMIYNGGNTLSTGGQVMNFLFNGTLFWMMSAFGAFLGLAFYRLNKMGRWILGICLGLFFNFGLPIMAGLYLPSVRTLFRALTITPGYAISAFLIFTVLFAAGCWILLRRAPVRPAGRG